MRGNHAASLRRLPRVFSFLFLFIILQFLLKDSDRPGIHAGMVGCRVDRGLFPSLLSALAVGFRFSFCVRMCVYVQRLSFIVNYKHYIHFFYRYLAAFFSWIYHVGMHMLKQTVQKWSDVPLKGAPDPYLQCLKFSILNQKIIIIITIIKHVLTMERSSI